MLGITYDTWKNTCKMYFDLGKGTKAAYLQWFPFTKISSADQDTIASEEFYNRYIKSGAFVLFPSAMHRSENFIQKGDGSFRDSSLLSPVLYLVLQAMGKEVSMAYSPQRGSQIEVFYAGNYDEMRPKYKQDYDDFFKAINAHIDESQYFIKTDLSSFFSNISVDLLVSRVDSICNKGAVRFSQTQLSIFKELLLYCGGGRFPLVENSIASSFLATVVYLDEIDSRLTSFIDAHISVFDSYKIIRYVDDMYILISSDHTEAEIHDAYNRIRNEYSSILKEYGLALNTKKCCIKPSFEINDELKKSLYDEFFHGEKHKIESLFSGSLASFLQEISLVIAKDCLDIEMYNALIEKHFGDDTIEFTATEVYNYYVYEDEVEVKSKAVISAIVKLINQDVSFISFDPKRISVLILKTQSTSAIKALLNQLFQRNRAGLWNTYDTITAISYLIQSEFRHIDLISVLCQNNQPLEEYYQYFCNSSFTNRFNNRRINSYCDIIGADWKANFLYFMFLVEQSKHNNLAKFAFYKNFFDRFTADLAFTTKYEANAKRPNYNRFYKEGEHKRFYSSIPNADSVIETAHKLRNANPLSHASAGLIDKDSTSSDLDDSIKNMGKLIDQIRRNNGL
ncbi:MAG: AbiA family abortive infection protein [Eubacteriales bacterium]|nr:AbiA family abortive infection protein [Eubacteriales bacterium]